MESDRNEKTDTGGDVPDRLLVQNPDQAFFDYREGFLMQCDDALLKDAYKERSPNCLDLGCNTGRYSRILADIGPAVTGLDFDPDMVEHATKRHANLLFLPGGCAASGRGGCVL